MEKAALGITVQGIVGNNIRKQRIAAKCSQQKLADMIGMNRTWLSDIETGKGNASIEILVKLADGLDVPIVLFFAGLEHAAPRKVVEYATFVAPTEE